MYDPSIMALKFLRHGESTSNSGENDCVDAGLTARGRQQVLHHEGHYPLVVVSPMRRTRETFQATKIAATHIIWEPRCRERISHPRDCMAGEKFVVENDNVFSARLREFKMRLTAWHDLFHTSGDILIVGHSHFFSFFDDRLRGIANGEIRTL